MAEKKSSGMAIAIIIGIIAVGVILWLMSRKVTAKPPPINGAPPVNPCPEGTETYMLVELAYPDTDFVEGEFYRQTHGDVAIFRDPRAHFPVLAEVMFNAGWINAIQYDCALAQWGAL